MSETPKFTPGPWLAAAAPSSVVGWPVVAQTGRAIASVAYLGIEPNKDRPQRKAFNAESMANAHLIAAAPELYEALKRAHDMLQSVAGDIEDGGSLDSLRGKYVLAILGARDAAYAALAKAEGR